MTIKTARAALSHCVFTGISRNHLDRLVAELVEPFAAAREGWLHRRRGGRRRRWPGAGPAAVLTVRDRVLVTLAWQRLALPHQAIAVLYGVDRSTISTAIRQIRPLPSLLLSWTLPNQPEEVTVGVGRPSLVPCPV